jgi:copper chaperone
MMTEKTLKVPDMHCGHCKAAVEGELSKLSGVKRANADVARGTVEVSYEERTVTTEDLKGAIVGAGYTVAA